MIKKHMASQFAHDIKNPLGNIVMYSEMLISDLKDAIEQKEITSILPQIEAMVTNISLSAFSLVTQVDSWSNALKLKDGTYKLMENQVNLTDLIDKAVTAHQIYFDNKKIQIIREFPFEEVSVYSDDFLIENILQNLMSLFLIYAAPGGIIKIVIEDLEDDYRISISDSYHGTRENIVHRFLHGIDVAEGEIPPEGILKPAAFGIMFCGEALLALDAGQKVFPSDLGGLCFQFTLPLA